MGLWVYISMVLWGGYWMLVPLGWPWVEVEYDGQG